MNEQLNSHIDEEVCLIYIQDCIPEPFLQINIGREDKGPISPKYHPKHDHSEALATSESGRLSHKVSDFRWQKAETCQEAPSIVALG